MERSLPFTILKLRFQPPCPARHTEGDRSGSDGGDIGNDNDSNGGANAGTTTGEVGRNKRKRQWLS